MGIVYEAEQSMGERVRSVAVKTLLPELSHDHVVVSRFIRECAVVASLEHPNTVRVYDFGKTPDGILYIAMEFVRGRPLGDLIAEGPIPLARCLGIVEQLCFALEEAHQQGIVHRDLKPENVILTERAGIHDFVKVLDFGIAMRSSQGGKHETKLTQQGMVLGTPPYMAPEQFSAESLDRTCDIYALAVIVYEMLNGRLPFEADTPWQWAHHHLSSTPDPFRVAVPAAVERVVFSGMSKLRQLRPQSTVEFLRQLQAAVAGEDGSAVVAQSRAVVKTEPSIALEPEGHTADAPGLRPWGNTEPPDSGATSGSHTHPARGQTREPTEGTPRWIEPAPRKTEREMPAMNAAGEGGARSYTATGAAPPVGAMVHVAGAALTPGSAAARGPSGIAARPAMPARRRKRRTWMWVSGLGLLLLAGAAAAAVVVYGDYFEDPMPPLPVTGAAVTDSSDPVLLAGDPSSLSFPQSVSDTQQPLTGSVRPTSPSPGAETKRTPNNALAKGGARGVATTGGPSASTPATTPASTSTDPSNPLPFPLPFPIPTGIIVNPFPPSTPAATTAAPAPTAAPTVQPATPSAAALAACTQATSLASSNMDAAVDQYQICQSGADAQSANRSRQTLAGIGRLRVAVLAKQGKCAEAQAVVTALSRIGAQARAQSALGGTSCAAP
jgi:serine/threonine protein kinase